MEYTRLKFGKQKGLYGSALAIAPNRISRTHHRVSHGNLFSIRVKTIEQNTNQSYLSPESAKLLDIR
jgi:hypothetical protein